MSRVTMKDYEDRNWWCGRSYLSTGPWRGSYRESSYRHSLGIAEVYQQTGRMPMTSIRFRHEGTEYMRSWNTNWGDKTIARLARELIEEVTRG